MEENEVSFKNNTVIMSLNLQPLSNLHVDLTLMSKTKQIDFTECSLHIFLPVFIMALDFKS